MRRVPITALAILATAAAAPAQHPPVLVEQTVADGRGGTYTRIVGRPAGHLPVSPSAGNFPPGPRPAVNPRAAFAGLNYSTPAVINYGDYGTPAFTFAPSGRGCANGRCVR